MSKEDIQRALELYQQARGETDPERLRLWANQDAITLQAETRLPWSVCLRLTQYARCRYWAALMLQRRRMRDVRQERSRMASHHAYFAKLRRAVGNHLPPMLSEEGDQETQVSAP